MELQTTGLLTSTNFTLSQPALIGRNAAGAGGLAEITLGSSLVFTGTTLNVGPHEHLIADVEGLTTALNGKAPTAHTHTPADITTSAATRLLGRGAGAGAGPAQELTLGNGLQMAGATLSAAGLTTLDKGTGAAASTQTFDVSAAGHQRLQVGGALTVAFTGWPSGFGELLVELVNGGLHIVTWPTIKWLRPDGTYVTTFAGTGVVLNSADTDWVLIWTGNGGTTLFGKVMR